MNLSVSSDCVLDNLWLSQCFWELVLWQLFMSFKPLREVALSKLILQCHTPFPEFCGLWSPDHVDCAVVHSY